MNPSEPSKVTSKKGKKTRVPEPAAPAAEPMQAKDAAEKQAMEVHSGVQDLHRRAGELEVQVGELDAELKSAREAACAAEGRTAELQQELAALRKQLEQVQGWSAELSAQVEKATAAEKAAREELAKTHEQHVTVIRAKDEKVAALENRAKEGLKRLNQAHDAALREQAARATASEKEAREELRKLRELHELMVQEAAPLRVQVAELKAQLDKAADLKKDVEALSQQVGQSVGAREKIRRELDEARSLLNHAREELKKTQDQKDESERNGAALRIQVADLERKAKEPPKEDPRIATLSADLRKAQDRVAELERKAAEAATLAADLKKAQERIAELDRKLREAPKEDPRIAGLQKELASTKTRAEKAEAQGAEAARYFESMEQTLIETRAEADQVEALRAELAKMKEECREHEDGLDQLSETVMELQHLLDCAAEAKPAPAVEAPKAPVVPPPPPPSLAFPKPEPTKLDLDFFDEAPAPKPPTAPVVVPAAVAVPAPATSSSETTLRTNNTFGPNGPDGQPIYLLHEMLPKDAMGVVYRASERADGRVFAVRFMAGQAGEEQTQAFEKEVAKLISLPHPNILHVQGTGRRKNRLYVMMDYVDAPTLGSAKIPEIPRICAILRDAAAAVHYAHEESIFHGALTPDTILVAKEDAKDLALVKDFGLASLLETQASGLRNPAYLPPEQVRVLKSPLSASVDVYGLGATLFAALTGKAPFEGNDPAKIVKRVMIEEPPPVEKFRPDVPKAVSAVVRRAMAKERGVRYATAGEFAEALTRIVEGR
ncbi:MAG: protein kinase [Planctomycetaceae bacterium]|nr:protein kinase [Planctomycetaceae bacterium]